jgi:hypothetical protein
MGFGACWMISIGQDGRTTFGKSFSMAGARAIERRLRLKKACSGKIASVDRR